MTTVTELIILLIVIIVILAFLYGCLWAIETYIAKIPDGLKVALAVVSFLLIVLVLIGALTGHVTLPKLAMGHVKDWVLVALNQAGGRIINFLA